MKLNPARPIVIVDDEKSFTDMIGMLLGEHLNAPVHTYTQATDVLEDLPVLQPGIIVTDYYMPGMSGLELIRTVHERFPAMPCILITGHQFDLGDYGSGDLGNLKAVLHKPFRWQQLADIIIKNWSLDSPPALQRSAHRVTS